MAIVVLPTKAQQIAATNDVLEPFILCVGGWGSQGYAKQKIGVEQNQQSLILWLHSVGAATVNK